MNLLLVSLDYWRHLLVAYAIVLGVEAPLLLFVASVRHRPWHERALALLPAGGFALGLYLARSADAALAYWQSYIAFQEAHYPPAYWATFARERRVDMQALVDSTQQQAVAMGVLALALLLGGWALLVYWLPNLRRAAHPIPSATLPAQPTDETQGSLEITIEPIEHRQ